MDLGEILAAAEQKTEDTEREVSEMLQQDNPSGAKRLLAARRREFQGFKQDVTRLERDAKSRTRQTQSRMQAGGQVASTVGSILGNPNARRLANQVGRMGRSAAKDRGTQHQREHRQARDQIDRYLAQVEKLKYDVDTALAEQKEQEREARKAEREARQARRDEQRAQRDTRRGQAER